MGVEVIDLFRTNTGFVERQLQGTCALFAGRIRVTHVMRIAGRAPADHFRVDARAAPFRVFIFFEHQHAPAFADDEPITFGVERP